MNATQLARKAYAPTTFSMKTGRATEAQIVGQITARLRAAAVQADRDFPALVRALHDNRRMWVILATDVADTENGLDPKLRAQIFYLAEFTDQHTAKVLRGEATADALIDINTAVLRGLNGGAAR